MKTTAILTAICLLSPCTLTAQEEPVEAAVVATAATYDTLTAAQKAQVDALITLCDQTTDTVKGLISGIKDRETADAAAPQLLAAFDALDTAWNELPEELLPAVAERIQPQKAKAEEVNALIQGLLHAEPQPFYGSIALASTLGEVSEQEVNLNAPTAGDAPADNATAEQTEAVASQIDACLTAAEKVRDVLVSVKDKETADAAAQGLRAMVLDFDQKCQALSEMMEKGNLTGVVSDLMEERFAGRMQVLRDLDDLVTSLVEEEPAFYGSEALEAELAAPAEEEPEATEE